jgi:hypothetical protein
MSKIQAAFADYQSPHELYRQVYKDVSCGPTIGMLFKGCTKMCYNDELPRNWGSKEVVTITVSSIVEGVDQGTEVRRITCSGKASDMIAKEFWAAVEAVNLEAETIWNETHGCEGCARHFGMDYIAGNTPIWLECPDCKGGGEVI